MSAIAQQTEIVDTIETAQGSASSSQSAIESKPLAGGEVTIKLALTPGMITMLVAPLTVLVTMLLAWVPLKSLGMPVYPHEMSAAAIVNTVGGMLAALPMFLLMNRGAKAIAQAGILGIVVRVGSILMGMVLAGAGGWGLDRMTLVYWVLGFYFPMLMVETATVAWLSHKARH